MHATPALVRLDEWIVNPEHLARQWHCGGDDTGSARISRQSWPAAKTKADLDGEKLIE